MKIVYEVHWKEADQCQATTMKRKRCKNPVTDGQVWYADGTVPDPSDRQRLAQRRCRVHVDKSIPAPDLEVIGKLDLMHHGQKMPSYPGPLKK